MSANRKLVLNVILLLNLSLFYSVTGSSQNLLNKQWDKSLGGSDRDFFSSMFHTADGGYVLGGASFSGTSGDKSQQNQGMYDFWLIKTDALGNKTWDKSFGGNNDDILGTIQQTSDGGYIVCGSSNSTFSPDKSQPNIGSYDCWLLKLDANGNKVWDKTFGGTSEDRLITVRQTPDGGYIMGGFSNSGISGNKTQACQGHHDYWLIKTDASGTKQWDKTFGGNSRDRLYDLQLTSDGGYIVGGFSNSGQSGDKSSPSKGSGGTTDYWIIKVNALGDKVWDKTFGGTGYDELTSLQQTSDGGFILTGYSDSGLNGDKSQQSKGSFDFWTLRLDGAGNKIWDKTFGGANNDQPYSVKQASDGGFLLGGMSTSGVSGDKTLPNKGSADFWVIKIDQNGAKSFEKSYGGNDEEFLISLEETNDEGLILSGYSDSGQSGDKTQASKGDRDFWLIKLQNNVTGIDEANSNLDLTIFPNPSDGNISIVTENILGLGAEINIITVLGQVVYSQQLTNLLKGTPYQINVSLAKGTYSLQFKTEKQNITKRFVIK